MRRDDGVEDDVVSCAKPTDLVAAELEDMRQKARARGTVANGNAADRQKGHVALASHTAFQLACASVTNAAAASTVLIPTEILKQLNALKTSSMLGFITRRS